MSDLVAELGDNYDRYHEALAEELERIGSQLPDPAAYRGRYEDYCSAGAYFTELFIAESLLRTFARTRGASGLADGLPLADERHRLVSGRPANESRGRRKGSQRTADWTPPPPPPGLPL